MSGGGSWKSYGVMIPQLIIQGVTIFKNIEKIIIIGAGGHAKVIIDILRTSSEYDFVGLIDPQHLGKTILGVPVIGDDSKLEMIYEEGVRTVFVAIGNNQQRGQISNYVKKIGFSITNAISNYSYVSSTVKLGEGIAIMPGAVINPDSYIGDNSIINTGSTIDHDCIISKNVHIAPGCNIAGNVKIGEGSFIGIGTKIIPDISVGSSTIIGAGSLVTTNIPSGCTAFGAPAKVQIQKEA
jgi:UDP-perosamine 4-acetyltransferase